MKLNNYSLSNLLLAKTLAPIAVVITISTTFPGSVTANEIEANQAESIAALEESAISVDEWVNAIAQAMVQITGVELTETEAGFRSIAGNWY
ncbi:hypothetical protein [Thalassoporum mexicanum]|uniref:hypothetical protein n=1 Tax=Thalassoporum mexicanum TaxID=3457544 RepID=UPI0002E504AD|nr:hypothetical protein [Pseudanabaena sp. PCC 7367]